jgi:hypothetical protein
MVVSMRITMSLLTAVLAMGCTTDSLTTSRNGVTGECETWEADPGARVLWPPNNKMNRFSLSDCVDIVPVECGPIDDDGYEKPGGPAPAASVPEVTLAITSITSDESITDDVVIVNATTFEIRAQRDGGGDGRVYTVNFVDQSGDTGACLFSVPHDQASSY